jgi:hypothetical protein
MRKVEKEEEEQQQQQQMKLRDWAQRQRSTGYGSNLETLYPDICYIMYLKDKVICVQKRVSVS